MKDFSKDIEIPLCVDLDGTLINTDCLHESTLLALKRKPFILFLIPFWLLTGGIAKVKSEVFKYGAPNPKYLPYNQQVIDYIKIEKEKGRKIILATASLQEIADSIAEYTGLFDEVLGTSLENNLRRGKKLKKLTESYGKKGFDYIGNSFSDLEVWAGSRYALLINTKKRIQRQAEKQGNVSKIFEFEKAKFKHMIKEIRVYQWVKNLLVFFPLILAHEFTNFEAITTLIFAFFSFSFTASSVYVVNDLLDLESDRVHSTKKNRPFASGQLPVHFGALLAPLLLFLGFILSAIFVSLEFTTILIFYFILTTLYSFILKRLYVVDIIVLASLYSLRIFAGGVAASVFISPWLISFSIFFFLSLSVVKRYTEILSIINKNKSKAKGRGYTASDKQLLLVSGVGSGLISVMIFTLYLNSPEVKMLYNIPELLYLITPLLIYAMLRIWFKTDRDEMTDDPIIFFSKDKPSLTILIIIFLIVIGASL